MAVVGRHCLATFLILVFTVAASCVTRAGIPEAIERARPAVVGVGTVQPTRRPPALFRGTGFVVGDGRTVLTNAHVLPEGLDERKRETLVVFSGRGADSRMHAARVLARDPDHDLAVLAIDGGPLPTLPLGDSDRVREGDLLLITGFPIGTVLGLFPVTHRAMVSAISPIAIPAGSARQLNGRRLKQLRDPFPVFQLDAVVYPGNSGSPLYDPQSGRVLGIINMVFVKGSKENVLTHPSGIAYAIPIAHARKLLEALR